MNGGADLTWDATPDDGGLPPDFYTVIASPGGASATTNGDNREAVINGLTNGQAYTFTVRAVTAVGSSSDSGASNSVTPSAPAPVATPTPSPTSTVAPTPDATPTTAPSIQPPVTATSTSAAIGLDNLTAPRVTGRAVMGHTLHATSGVWSVPVSSIRYEWFRGKKKISGATHSSYRLGAADRGSRIRVLVLAVAGSSRSEAYSSWSAKVSG